MKRGDEKRAQVEKMDVRIERRTSAIGGDERVFFESGSL